MGKLWSDLGTADFWFSVVIVGIAVNLLSKFCDSIALPKLIDISSFWWRRRRGRLTKKQADHDQYIETLIKVVADQPALLAAFLLRSYVLFVMGAGLCAVGLWSFFGAFTGDTATLIVGPAGSWFWWAYRSNEYFGAAVFLTMGYQFLKSAAERYRIAINAEAVAIESGLKKLSEGALPSARSET